MFCYQCQEAAKNTGCTVRGVCGKQPETADLQDLVMYVCRGIGLEAQQNLSEADLNKAGRFVAAAMFSTITNANFDDARMKELVKEGLELRDELVGKYGKPSDHDVLTWKEPEGKWMEKAQSVGVKDLSPDLDVRSLRELSIYGLKGIAAYATHALVLGYEDTEIWKAMLDILAGSLQKDGLEELKALVLKTGDTAVQTMALLDKANTETYGKPEITEVNIGVGKNPGILISGHDLKDMEALLEQTKGTGVDVYTHSEMLPANYYPAFKKYDHFHGNYGGSWWKQGKEFETFNGPILMTTNCITPVKDSYKDRIFTTGQTGYPGVTHIREPENEGQKDFTQIIELAKTCDPPTEIETGKITGGFAHDQVLALADQIVDAVNSGAIKRFVVMAGCDGRHKERQYFTDVAQQLPEDAVILTAGCAKYRYNKLDLGDIGGIPRVLDAGQCNDSYSLAVIALKLKEVFGLHDVNELPLAFDIAWYEQKAVCVFLALLSLGFKKLRVGPTLPAFLSPNVTDVLVREFGIMGTTTVDEDVAAIMA
ncbi:MAG: hydroxylamine reductase [Spirochaetia bacterium]